MDPALFFLLQKRFGSINWIILLLALLIFHWGSDLCVGDEVILNYDRLLGNICKKQNVRVRVPMRVTDETKAKERNAEILGLSRCKDKDDKWLLKCLNQEDICPPLLQNLDKDCYNEIFIQFPNCAKDIKLLCFEVIEGLRPLLNTTSNSNMFTSYLLKEGEFNLPQTMTKWEYFQFRQTIFTEAGEKNQLIDFYSDKERTKSCVGKIFDDVKCADSLCVIIPDKKNYDKTKVKENMKECFGKINNLEEASFVIKPNHMTNAVGGMIVTSDKKLKKNKVYSFPLKFRDVDKVITETKLTISDKELMKIECMISVRKGIIVEKTVRSISKFFFELRFYAVFGEIVLLHFSGDGQCKISGYFAQMHKTFNNEWICSPKVEGIPSMNKGRGFETENSICCDNLKNNFELQPTIETLEKLAFRLHLDFIRIDIFPISKNSFIMNEIEVDSGIHIRGIRVNCPPPPC